MDTYVLFVGFTGYTVEGTPRAAKALGDIIKDMTSLGYQNPVYTLYKDDESKDIKWPKQPPIKITRVKAEHIKVEIIGVRARIGLG